MVADPDYRQGLSAEELVGTLRSLLAVERKTMRLTCRYLADLADAMEPLAGAPEPVADAMHSAAGGLFGRERAGGVLAAHTDVVHAAECLFGLAAHSTRERIRVGRALRSLPKIEGALLSGELSYSRAREVTRVATPADESTWLDLASTLPMRSLERRVVEATGTGTGTGTGEESPPRTDGPAQLRWSSPETVEVTLRLPAEVWALVKRAMEGARRASEASLSEAEALAAVARDALDRQNTGTDASDPRHTVVLYECQSCARTEVDTGAGPLELGEASAATLGCGARVRDLRTEGRVVRRGGPLPKAIDRAVRLRDRHTCRVPGCHRRRYVDVHHLHFQSEGGEHSRSNCVCLCTTHHALLHEGRLRIEGDAEGELLFYGRRGHCSRHRARPKVGCPRRWARPKVGCPRRWARPNVGRQRSRARPKVGCPQRRWARPKVGRPRRWVRPEVGPSGRRVRRNAGPSGRWARPKVGRPRRWVRPEVGPSGRRVRRNAGPSGRRARPNVGRPRRWVRPEVGASGRRVRPKAGRPRPPSRPPGRWSVPWGSARRPPGCSRSWAGEAGGRWMRSSMRAG